MWKIQFLNGWTKLKQTSKCENNTSCANGRGIDKWMSLTWKFYCKRKHKSKYNQVIQQNFSLKILASLALS